MRKNRFFWALPILYIALTLACWLHAPNSESLSERRKLAQMPKMHLERHSKRKLCSNFESYTQDQFPCGRPSGRQRLCFP